MGAQGLGMPQDRGKGGVSQRTLSRPKWEEGFEERESVIIGEVSSLE